MHTMPATVNRLAVPAEVNIPVAWLLYIDIIPMRPARIPTRIESINSIEPGLKSKIKYW